MGPLEIFSTVTGFIGFVIGFIAFLVAWGRFKGLESTVQIMSAGNKELREINRDLQAQIALLQSDVVKDIIRAVLKELKENME